MSMETKTPTASEPVVVVVTEQKKETKPGVVTIIKGTIYRTNGKTETVELPKAGSDAYLKFLQKAVGGYVEMATSNDGKFDLYYNEEGLLLKLATNAAASKLVQGSIGTLCGDVIAVPHNYDLPDD